MTEIIDSGLWELYEGVDGSLIIKEPKFFEKQYIQPKREAPSEYSKKKPQKYNAEFYKAKKEIFERDKYICQYCGKKCEVSRNYDFDSFITLSDVAHLDHIIPLSKGGTNDKENLVTTCGACNRKKRNKILIKQKIQSESGVNPE